MKTITINSLNFIEEVLGKDITHKLIVNLLNQKSLPLGVDVYVYKLVGGCLSWSRSNEGYAFWKDVNTKIVNCKDAYIPFTIKKEEF